MGRTRKTTTPGAARRSTFSFVYFAISASCISLSRASEAAPCRLERFTQPLGAKWVELMKQSGIWNRTLPNDMIVLYPVVFLDETVFALRRSPIKDCTRRDETHVAWAASLRAEIGTQALRQLRAGIASGVFEFRILSASAALFACGQPDLVCILHSGRPKASLVSTGKISLRRRCRCRRRNDARGRRVVLALR